MAERELLGSEGYTRTSRRVRGSIDGVRMTRKGDEGCSLEVESASSTDFGPLALFSFCGSMKTMESFPKTDDGKCHPGRNATLRPNLI